jgi:phenylacetate-coenzyme A ligase PaaK-like adenylate-forming protein
LTYIKQEVAVFKDAALTGINPSTGPGVYDARMREPAHTAGTEAKRVPARRRPAGMPPSGGGPAPVAAWGWLPRMTELWWTRNAGRAAIDAARAARTSSLLAFARERSVHYRRAWSGLPQGTLALTQLPVATKRELMLDFDAWVTDPAVRRQDVEAFLADRSQIGERYLGRYVVWKSSGSTGEPGIFVQDESALATYDALIAIQLSAGRLAAPYLWGLLARGGRAALIAATGDHFASIASWQRVCRGSPWPNARAFSVLDPLPRIVAGLNGYRPAFVASYPTMLALLAAEQAAGHLRLQPTCLWSGGEYLPPATAAAIERAFGCPLINEYGASECMSIAFGCREGALHVNEDWVVLEPVDRDFQPVPPGEASHTVLLTNLANRVQPVIRYDLGDSVLVAADPCPCGSPLQAIRAQGRQDDVVTLTTAEGVAVSLVPLALTTVVEEAADIHRFQIVAQPPHRLALRLDPGEARRTAWHAAARALSRYLAAQSLGNVEIVLDPHPPIPDARSGKLREVIVEHRR